MATTTCLSTSFRTSLTSSSFTSRQDLGTKRCSPSLSPLLKPSLKTVTAMCTDSGNPGQSRRALLNLAAATAAAVALSFTAPPQEAKANLIDDLLAKSSANKELNDAKRLATSGANASRPWTVEFGTCKFPDNFTGCDDLAKKQGVAFITDDLELECEGKEPGKCASNNLWNARSTGLAEPGGGTPS